MKENLYIKEKTFSIKIKNGKKRKLHFLFNYFFFNKKSFVTSNKIKYLSKQNVEK